MFQTTNQYIYIYVGKAIYLYKLDKHLSSKLGETIHSNGDLTNDLS
jgi:hypothetical protein